MFPHHMTPILPCGAQQAFPNGPHTNNDHKHTAPGPPLPDFYLQNTCKFAVQSAAWITVLTTRALQKDTRVLKHLFPPVLRSAACDVLMAEHGIRIVKIP